jgi:hypothetical protein
VIVSKRVDTSLGEQEQLLHGLVNGDRTVDKVIRDSRLGEFDALKALAKMHRLGLIDIKAQASTERSEDVPLPEAMEWFAAPLRVVHQTLKVEAPGQEDRLEAYLGSPSPMHREVFLNVGFDEEGRLDLDTLYRNARRAQPDDPRLMALEALRGLYDYAVFQAMDALEDEVCDDMMVKLQTMRTQLGGAQGE